ncbi:MAG: hypothetical protein IJP76_04860 [Paludibacteraceae bacterium]|nr:hypothetical protein [Paludibacteraceae bacterium]
MKRSLLLIGILTVVVCAQAQHTFELGLHGGVAGYHSLHSYVSMQPSANTGLHAAYGYYSQHVIGFRIGVSADMHRTGWSKKGYTDSYTTIDVENQTMQIDYTIGSLREMYTIWSVGIPAQIALKWKKVGVYLGPKVVFPISCSWTEKAQNAALSVYYPDYDNRVFESYPLAASRSFAMDNKGKASLPKMQWWLAGEISYDIPFRNYSKAKSCLTVGIYADYCLSRTNNTNDLQPSLITLTDTRDGFPLSRILCPVLSSQRQGQPLVSRYSLFDVGIKLSYTFSSHNTRARRNYPCRCYGVWQ